MPPADDPLARLHGRNAFYSELETLHKESSAEKLSLPLIAGKTLDLYLLFEVLRGLQGIPCVNERSHFQVAKSFLLLRGTSINAIKSAFETHCAPNKERLEIAVEEAYKCTGQAERGKKHKWIINRLRKLRSEDGHVYHVRDRCRSHGETKSIDPEAKEELALLSQPEVVQAVIRARLNEASLDQTERDHSMFKSKESETVIVDLRNHIIRMWFRDTRKRLSWVMALKLLPRRYHNDAVNIFTYLESAGTINFGAISMMRVNLTALGVGRKQIAIVGAGMAGLSAARHLESFGFEITIFEGRDRPGGRIHTSRGTMSTPIDMGAMLITGVIQNPVAILAHQTNSPMHFMDGGCPLFDIDGKLVPTEADSWAEKEYNRILDVTNRYRMRSSYAVHAERMSLGSAFRRALHLRTAARKKLLRERHSETSEQVNCVGLDLSIGHENAAVANLKGTSQHSSPERFRASNRTGTRKRGSQRYAPSATQYHPNSIPPRKRTRHEIVNFSDEQKCDGSESSFTSLVGDNEEREQRQMYDRTISRLLRWHVANLEYACAAGIEEVSLMHWDQDDPFGFAGEHVLLQNGYSPLIDGLLKGMERCLKLNHTVTGINYGLNDDKVSLSYRKPTGETQKRDFDSVLVTVPLGVLKKGTIKFEPPLPPAKQEAIDRLGFGGLMKVAMEFREQFWVKCDMFGALREDPEKRGEFYFFWNLFPCTGKPILVGVVAEPNVRELEQLPDKEILNRAMNVLRNLYPSSPEPHAYQISRWSNDEFAGGAYTNIPVGSSGDDYDTLAERVGKSVYFGGEHTCREYPTTCASAIISGLRESNKILEYHDVTNRIAKVRALNEHTRLVE